MRVGEPTTSVNGEVITVTRKAVLLEQDVKGEIKATWIPKSVIEDGDAVEKGEIDLVVADWFCEREGLS